MNCPKCNEVIQTGAAFCKNCGFKIIENSNLNGEQNSNEYNVQNNISESNQQSTNVTDEDLQKERDQVINCTLEDLKQQKELIEAVLQQNYICVVGNETRIEKTEGIFTNKRSLL